MTRTCTQPGCEGRHEARGLCNAHYLRLRNGKPLDAPIARKMSEQERFWAKVDKSGECWEWTARKTHDGYGYFRVGDTMKRVHRLSYVWHHGPIPDGMQIDHTCWHPGCVRPDHLRAVPAAENSQNRSGARKGNRSGVRGVSWDPKTRKWRAHAWGGGMQNYLGFFASVEAAEAVVVAWRREHMPGSLMDKRKEPA